MRYDILIGQEHVSSRIVKTRQEYEILTLVYEFVSIEPRFGIFCLSPPGDWAPLAVW